MAATRDDLRDHLTAVINAAQELPAEDRSYLADTFLDELESQYRLVPHSHDTQRTAETSSQSWFAGFPSVRGTAPVAVMVLLSVLFLPLLMVSFFVLIHPPVFLLALAVLVFFRFGRRRWPGSYGSRRGHMSHYNY